MAKIEIRLTKAEIFKAMKEYVNNHYPNMDASNASIFTQYNSLQYGVVECQYSADDKEEK